MVTPAIAALALRDPFESEEHLLKAKVPVVILHGTRDQVIPFSESQKLKKALGEQARLVPLEGLGHNDVVHRASDQIVEEVVRLARGK